MFAWLPATACSKARRSSPSVEQRKQAKCAISSINPPIACLHPTCFGRLARNDVQRTPTLLTSSGFTSVKPLLFCCKLRFDSEVACLYLSSRSGFRSGAARVSYGAALMAPTSQRKLSNGGLCRKRRGARRRVIQKQAQRARVRARPPFSVFYLHLFTFVG